LKRARKEQIVMCYLLVTRGRLPSHLGKLLQAMREIVGGASEAEVRTSTKWALRQMPAREPRKVRRARRKARPQLAQ
jgi:hypothetical protein